MSLANATGKGAKVTIKGEEYTLSPLTIDDLAEFETDIKSRNMKAIAGLENAGSLAIEILNSSVNTGSLLKEMRTMAGVRFILYRALKKNHPEIKLDNMSALVDLDNMQELSDIVANLGGSHTSSKNQDKAEEKN